LKLPVSFVHEVPKNVKLLKKKKGIAVLEETDMEVIHQKISEFEATGNWEFGIINQENEARMISLLVGMFKDALNDLNQIIFEKEELNSSLNMRFLSYYCEGQKRVIESTLTIIC